jgi:hypothetical protein
VKAPALVFSGPCRQCGHERFTAARRNARVRLSCERCLHTRWEPFEVLERRPPRVEAVPSDPTPPPRPPAWQAPVFAVEGLARDHDVASGYGSFRPVFPRNPDGSLHERDVRRWELRQAQIAQDYRRRSQSPWVTDESSRWPRRG